MSLSTCAPICLYLLPLSITTLHSVWISFFFHSTPPPVSFSLSLFFHPLPPSTIFSLYPAFSLFFIRSCSPLRLIHVPSSTQLPPHLHGPSIISFEQVLINHIHRLMNNSATRERVSGVRVGRRLVAGRLMNKETDAEESVGIGGRVARRNEKCFRGLYGGNRDAG